MNQESRQNLMTLPCDIESEIDAYRHYIQDSVWKLTGKSVAELPIDPHPAWEDINTIPDSVQKKSEEIGVNITVEVWASLTNLQRFALIKLSRSSHENKNFLPALQEFKIIE
jgi:hypothetical protein